MRVALLPRKDVRINGRGFNRAGRGERVRLGFWSRTSVDCVAHLVEANIVGVLPEALTAQAEAVFTDQTMVVGAGPAGREQANG